MGINNENIKYSHLSEKIGEGILVMLNFIYIIS